MPKYKVEWVKKLHIEGETVVEADSAYDAEVLVWRMDQDEWGNGDGELHHDESEIFCVTEEKEDD